jgi:hypothetical protein
MASFLNTQQIIQSISTIISNSKKELVLISPFIQINDSFAESLTRIDANGRKTTLVFGKCILNPYEENFLTRLKNLDLRYFEHLHAKCYYNESYMIIGSMNMYEASERNNEMGVLINAETEDDMKLYKDAKMEAEFIIDHAERISLNEIVTCTLYVPPKYERKSLGPVLNAIWLDFKNTYKNYEVIPTMIEELEMVVIENWLFRGIELRVGGVIQVVFYNTNNHLIECLKESMETELNEVLNNCKIYWNKYWNRTQLSIYPQKIDYDVNKIHWIQSKVVQLQYLLSKNASILNSIPQIS